MVIELYESFEIKLFFYKMFVEFSEFIELFKYLGCFFFVIFLYYVMVLEMLYGRCKVKELYFNEVDSVLKVVKGFFGMM